MIWLGSITVRRWLPNHQAAKIAGMSSWPNSALFNTATAPKLSARTRESSSSPLDKDRNDADLSAVQPDGRCVQAGAFRIPFVVLFDGVVSCLRTYPPQELREIIEKLTATGYQWRRVSI
jgi:hypothetical protein